MEDLRAYLLSVTAAAVLCGLAERFLGKKAGAARFLTSVFLVLTVLRPLGQLDSRFWQDIHLDIPGGAEEAVAQGEIQSRQAMAQVIKEETGAYILKKAQQLNADIQVSVEVSDEALPMPVGVRITGSIAPYAKLQLQTFLEQQLGISKENQQWT